MAKTASSAVSIIAGGAAGGFIIVLIVIAFIFYIRRNRVRNLALLSDASNIGTGKS